MQSKFEAAHGHLVAGSYRSLLTFYTHQGESHQFTFSAFISRKKTKFLCGYKMDWPRWLGLRYLNLFL